MFIDTGGGIVSATRGLTFLQWDGENFFTHTVNYDSFERRFVLNSKEGVQ